MIMKRVTLKSMLAVFMLLVSLTNVSAYNFQVDGIYYDIVELYANTCSVTSGDADYAGDVVIPEKVTYNSREFTVISINERAFYSDVNLQSVVIPNSVTAIAAYTFYNCTGLKSVTFGDKLKTIGNQAFYGCSRLESITLSNEIEEIGTFAFTQSGLTSIEIPSGIIEQSAFNNCENLKSVVIGDGVTEIGNSVFQDCTKLETISIGNSVEKIGIDALNNCAIKSLKIPDNVEEIGYNICRECKELESVEIGNGVITISDMSFFQCENLKSVLIGESVETINRSAFAGCYKLESIVIPNNVETIKEQAFEACGRLKSITLGSELKTIEQNVFRGCDDLEEITSLNTVPPVFDASNFTTQQYVDVMVYVPAEAVNTYRNAAGWRDFFSIQAMEAGVKNVGAADGVQVRVVDGSIIADGIENNGGVMSIYNIGGQCVYSGSSSSVSGLASGVYVVRIGDTVTKVIL